jgi:hypothetical protein
VDPLGITQNEHSYLKLDSKLRMILKIWLAVPNSIFEKAKLWSNYPVKANMQSLPAGTLRRLSATKVNPCNSGQIAAGAKIFPWSLFRTINTATRDAVLHPQSSSASAFLWEVIFPWREPWKLLISRNHQPSRRLWFRSVVRKKRLPSPNRRKWRDLGSLASA